MGEGSDRNMQSGLWQDFCLSRGISSRTSCKYSTGALTTGTVEFSVGGWLLLTFISLFAAVIARSVANFIAFIAVRKSFGFEGGTVIY